MDDTEQPVVTFTNEAPEDKEWTAHIKLLNEYCTPERFLREIVQYARSGPFYPADMHVSLIRQATQPSRPVPTPVDGDIDDKLEHCRNCGAHGQPTHPVDGEHFDHGLRKLFKDYSVGVSAGLNATVPKTIVSAEEHLNACIELAHRLFAAYLQAAVQAERDCIAKAIFDEEQKANAVLQKGSPQDSGYTHLSGRIVGLQRARDIVEHLKKEASK